MGVKHLIKHLRALWYIRKGMPRWRTDKVAQMMGINLWGCPVCGYNAVAEWKRHGGGESWQS